MNINTFISDYRNGEQLHKICEMRGYDRAETLKLIESIKNNNKSGRAVNQAFKELLTDRYLNGGSILSMSNEIGSTWSTVRKWIDEVVEQRYGKVV
ncbi:hypothetical protein [Halalkalibacter oceani]|uniref:hypothetical protein n=1 Tax=Halalkalibacter oceani TaxID=1653776 RepID=UPI003399B005